MVDAEDVSSRRAVEDATRSGRRVVVLFVAGVIAVAGYFALGMPGMDHGSDAVQHEGELHP